MPPWPVGTRHGGGGAAGRGLGGEFHIGGEVRVAARGTSPNSSGSYTALIVLRLQMRQPPRLGGGLGLQSARPARLWSACAAGRLSSHAEREQGVLCRVAGPVSPQVRGQHHPAVGKHARASHVRVRLRAHHAGHLTAGQSIRLQPQALTCALAFADRRALWLVESFPVALLALFPAVRHRLAASTAWGDREAFRVFW